MKTPNIAISKSSCPTMRWVASECPVGQIFPSRLRDEIDEDIELPVSSFRFKLADGGMAINRKQEKNWKEWSIWSYLDNQGDDSALNPYSVFIEEAM